MEVMLKELKEVADAVKTVALGNVIDRISSELDLLGGVI